MPEMFIELTDLQIVNCFRYILFQIVCLSLDTHLLFDYARTCK